MPDIDAAETPRPPGGWRHEPWTVVVALATVVATIVAVLAYLYPRDASSSDPSAQPGRTGIDATAVATELPGSTSPTGDPGGTGAEGVYLDTLRPVEGGSRLKPLPRELGGAPGYQHAVVITCPSNQTGDTASEVVYETRKRYQTLTATLRPYLSPPDGVLADLFVYQDAADRLPGGPTGSPPTQVRVTMGESEELSAPISAAVYLRLRVVCQKPGGLMILSDATLIA